MRSETRFPDKPMTAGPSLLAGVCALTLCAAGIVRAEEDRRAAFLPTQSVTQERHAREMPNFTPEFLRRQDLDEGRGPPRRWSLEERQQLRQRGLLLRLFGGVARESHVENLDDSRRIEQ